MKGWIKLHRKLQEHWIWSEKRKFSKFEAWIYILFQANHKNKKTIINGQLVEIKKGEFVTSEVKLAEKWNWDRKIVRKFLKTLENENMIIRKSTAKYTSITVENWDLYQKEEQQNEQQNEQPMDRKKVLESEKITAQKAIAKYTSVMLEKEGLYEKGEQQNAQQKEQQRDNRKDSKEDTNKKIKNDKNDKNYIPISEEKSSSISVKANKHKYGEYKNVLLKEEELQNLKGDYQNWEELIKYLDEYIEMKGYKAKSHYLCIKKWVAEAVKRESNRQVKKNVNDKNTDWLKEALENED